MGPPWGPKVPLKVRNTRLGHKSTLSEKFRGIMKIGSKNFGHESGARLTWASCTDLRSFGRLAAAIEPYPGWSVYEKSAGARMTHQGNVFWRLRFLDCRYPGCAPRNTSTRRCTLETSCGCLWHCSGSGGISVSLQRQRFKSNPKRP